MQMQVCGYDLMVIG